MRISKDSAEQIALAICNPLLLKKNVAKKEFEAAVKAAYLDSTPTPIIELFKKFPDYFETAQSVAIDGNGFNNCKVTFEGRVPAKSNYYTLFKPSSSAAKKLIALQQTSDELASQYDKMLKETEVALLTLRTYKAIADAIPESIPFLPASASTAITLNLTGLRKQIKAVQAA